MTIILLLLTRHEKHTAVRTLSKIYALTCYIHIHLIRHKFKYNMPYYIRLRLYRYFLLRILSSSTIFFVETTGYITNLINQSHPQIK